MLIFNTARDGGSKRGFLTEEILILTVIMILYNKMNSLFKGLRSKEVLTAQKHPSVFALEVQAQHRLQGAGARSAWLPISAHLRPVVKPSLVGQTDIILG